MLYWPVVAIAATSICIWLFNTSPRDLLGSYLTTSNKYIIHEEAASIVKCIVEYWLLSMVVDWTINSHHLSSVVKKWALETSMNSGTLRKLHEIWSMAVMNQDFHKMKNLGSTALLLACQCRKFPLLGFCRILTLQSILQCDW